MLVGDGADPHDVRVPAPTRRTLLGAGLASVSVAAGLTACDAEAPAADPTPTPSPTVHGVATDSASPSASAAATAPTIPDFDPTDWESVRAQFPLDPAMAQFAAFVLSPHTAQVDAAIDYHRSGSAFDTEGTLLEGFELEDAVRQAAADYAGGAPGQYALTDSTTMGIALMYGGLALRPGDEVLTTTHDFFSTEDSLRLLDAAHRRQGQAGHALRRAVAGDRRRDGLPAGRRAHPAHQGRGGDLGALLDRRPAADPGDQRRPIDWPGRRLLCVDGVHGFAAVDVDLPDLGCDFLSAGTHKWLFGPRGTGILWGRDCGPADRADPVVLRARRGARLSPGGYHSFEHRWALDQALRVPPADRPRGRRRSAPSSRPPSSRRGWPAATGVRVVTPADPEVSAGIVCLDVEGLPPGNGVLRAPSSRASWRARRRTATSYLRLGPCIVTTPEQVDAAVEAVAPG